MYEPAAPGWFRGGEGAGGEGAGGEGIGDAGAWTPANWDSPADAGWRAAESAATPVRGQLTTAGLPQRIPRANIVPGSAGERQVPSASYPAAGVEHPAAGVEHPAVGVEHPPAGGTRRSADALRARLAGLQQGTRRAENAVASRVNQAADE